MTAGCPRAGRLAATVAVAALASGCDPIVNFYGSFFPAWAVCLLAGVVLAVVLRFAFAATGLEEGIAPLVLVYPALAILLACITWLVLFRG
jgi:ABC-type transport system involved in cytochrome bd biosynthesis fused ATPase/permease subunit